LAVCGAVLCCKGRLDLSKTDVRQISGNARKLEFRNFRNTACIANLRKLEDGKSEVEKPQVGRASEVGWLKFEV